MSETYPTKPVFTVVMPVYNKEPHVARAIRSVLAQNFASFELVIVCDPSTDKSNVEVAKFVDERIRVFNRSEPGAGGYAARNLGIAHGRGEWIAFLDADDEWAPDHLERMDSAIQTHADVQFLASGYEIIEEGLKTFRSCGRSEAELIVTFEDFLTARLFYTSCVVVKKSLLHEVGLFPAGIMRRGGDEDTWLRAIERAGWMLWLNYCGAVYHRDSVGMVTKQSTFTLNDLKQESVRSFIGKYQGSIRTKLKLRYNNTILYAWNQNMRVDPASVFGLDDLLFDDVQPIRSFLYRRFAKLPLWLSRRLHAFARSALK